MEKSNIVYYYCDLNTGLSILKNNELWLTSIRNMNDSNEEISIYKIFCNMLRKYDCEKQLNAFFSLADISGYFQSYKHSLAANPYYVACFSKDGDSVSQWNLYADKGQGIAIGFDELEFKRLDNEDIINYYNVEYIDSNIIQKEAKEIYEIMLNINTNNGGRLMDVFVKYISEKYGNPEQYKSSHYSSEKEVGIVYKEKTMPAREINGWKLGNVDVYAKRNCINTYMPLVFPKSAVKEIVLGPMYQKNYFEVDVAIRGYLNMERLLR